MKQPLIISCRGSEEVRSKCTPFLEIQLQTIPLQWRRSDAEFPLNIQLNAKFIAFTPALIKRKESRWQDVAAVHLYFMDCWDSEKYRLDVRSDLIEWFATLRDADTNDWLVVFDTCKARESRGRGQVLEKLRSDLSKYVNRIVEIDSANYKMPAFLRALADQALISFDHWAQLFETNLKSERDACFSLDWSFINYMATQVQYSRLLLSVNVFEQALAQLDELDAMLSLLISHYASSTTKAKWIESLSINNTEQTEVVSLVSLYSRFDDIVRQLLSEVEENNQTLSSSDGRTVLASDLRRIRALIFSCQLSVVLNRYACQSVTAEAACQRVIWYGAVLVQAIRKEEAILSGSAENQARFRLLSNALWCLEVLNFAGRLCDLAVVVSESESMCTLWMTLCRMVQNLDPILVGDSIAWFPKGDQRTENDLPLSVLEKCMVEISAFDEHFVKWHESALAMLKHYGWRRHARTIGIALADFHRRRGKDVEALHLFLKLARQLEEERWCQAYIGLLLKIGDDLMSHCTLRERLKFFGDLSCSSEFLPKPDLSIIYCSKFKAEFESDWSYERMSNSPVCPWFIIRSIKPDQRSILCGSVLQWTIVLDNRFPESLRIFSISLCCSISPNRQEPTIVDKKQLNISGKPKKLADYRRISYSTASDSADCSEYYTMGLQDEDGRLENELASGRNILKFIGKCQQFGTCVPEHLHIRLGDDGRLDIQARIGVDILAQCVIKTLNPEITLIAPCKGESLWAGVTQTINFRLMVGAVVEKLDEKEEKYLRLETPNSDLQLTTATQTEEENQTGLSIGVPSDLLPGASFEIEQNLFCNIHGSNESRTCEVTTYWRGCNFKHYLHFKPIFHWMSNLKVIGERLLLTITLHNDGQIPLILRHPKLTFTSLAEKGGDIDAELLNDGIEQDLYFAIPFTLAWYIPTACSSSGVIEFHYQFKDSSPDTYTCYADVALQKPAIVEACCQMASEKIVCRVGMSCDFVVSLKAFDQSLRSVDVFVTLVFDAKFWSCTGTLSELVQLKENGLGQAFFQVIPQCVGFLPMPSVEIQLSGEAALTKTCQAYVRSKGKQVHVLAPLSAIRRSFNDHAPRTQLEIGL